MTDKEIQNLLTSYVGAEMSLVYDEELLEQDYAYSKSYNNRIRRMFWSEKYFGSRLHVGYMVRRIAIAAIIILGLLVTNEVSARVFGINLWQYTTSFLTDSKMDVKTYIAPKENTNNRTDTTLPSITRDVPLLIPDGFTQTTLNQNNTNLYIEWNMNKKKYLQYSRTKLSTGMSIIIDGEYQLQERISILGFVGDCYVKGNETWIMWNDATYNHTIIATNIKKPKETLIKIAESLYK